MLERTLTALGFTVTATGPGTANVTIPSWRSDVQGEADLVEELARLYGVDRIPSTPPRCVLAFSGSPAE